MYSSALLPFVVYFTAFVATGGLCFIAAHRSWKSFSDNIDARNAFVTLLVLSGVWSFLQAIFMTGVTGELASGIYISGLIVGLAAVFSWLAFASAVTQRSYHRNARLQAVSAIIFVGIATLKLTNPIHGQYFAIEMVSTPFYHASVTFAAMHWIITIFAYLLSGVGLFLLMELLVDTHVGVVTFTALSFVIMLPVGVDLLALLTDGVLLGLNHEPIGVGLFAIGLLFVLEDSVLGVSEFGRYWLFESLDQPVLLMDTDGTIVERNNSANESFDDIFTPDDDFQTVLESFESASAHGREYYNLPAGGSTGKFSVSRFTLDAGQTELGELVVLSDMTTVFKNEQEVLRHNSQLQGFADAITHELRNTLLIVEGRKDILEEAVSDSEVAVPGADAHFGRMEAATSRMEDIVSDLSVIARSGQTVDEFDQYLLSELAEAGLSEDLRGDVDVAVSVNGEISAEYSRAVAFFESIFEFVEYNDGSKVLIEKSDGGFTMRTDGNAIAGEASEALFEYGEAIPDAEAGLSLPNAKMIAQAHDWKITADTGRPEGVLFTITF